MQPFAIAQARLDGVAEGVAEVEDGAQAAFLLVLAHHPGLDLATAAHGGSQQHGVAGQQTGNVGLDPVKKRHVGNRAVLDDFGQARAQLIGQAVGHGAALRLQLAAIKIHAKTGAAGATGQAGVGHALPPCRAARARVRFWRAAAS